MMWFFLDVFGFGGRVLFFFKRRNLVVLLYFKEEMEVIVKEV